MSAATERTAEQVEQEYVEGYWYGGHATPAERLGQAMRAAVELAGDEETD